jgi:dienelactone hydrolase
VVATRAVRTLDGRRTRAGAAFRAMSGRRGGRRSAGSRGSRRLVDRPDSSELGGHGGRGQRSARRHEAVFVDDPLDARNPFPSDRLVELDGSIQIPDGFTARALADDPRLDGVRAFLQHLDDLTGEHAGFSPHAAAVVHFDEPVRLRSATPASVFIAEVVHPLGAGSPAGVPALLAALERDRGIRPGAVTAASLFAIEDVIGTMMGIRSQIAGRAAAAAPRPAYGDPDPADGRRFGVFDRGDPALTELFPAGVPASVGRAARGTFASPEYRRRDAAGRLRVPATFLDGAEDPPLEPLEFVVVVPSGPPPPDGFPTVIAQHGFCGDNGFVLDVAEELTAAGLAVLGVHAPEHGPGRSCFGFFVFDDFNAFGANWQQASASLFQLAQLVVAGVVDLDGDGQRDLRATDLGYLGVSMGGVVGAVFAAVEPLVGAVVLNVPGGKLAQFAGSVSSLAAPFLEAFAIEAGIASRRCGGTATGAACRSSASCAAGETCDFSPDFTAFLDAALPSFQAQLDPGDGSAYAHLFRLHPPEGRPKPVLVQEGIGDIVVANALTEALARGIGLSANRPDRAAGGVSGLWRFPPPDGHGILALPEVRAQAVHFLASGGTEIVAP